MRRAHDLPSPLVFCSISIRGCLYVFIVCVEKERERVDDYLYVEEWRKGWWLVRCNSLFISFKISLSGVWKFPLMAEINFHMWKLNILCLPPTCIYIYVYGWKCAFTCVHNCIECLNTYSINLKRYGKMKIQRRRVRITKKITKKMEFFFVEFEFKMSTLSRKRNWFNRNTWNRQLGWKRLGNSIYSSWFIYS